MNSIIDMQPSNAKSKPMYTRCRDPHHHLTPVLTLAVVILSAPTVNTLITDFDEPNLALPPLPQAKNAVCERVRRDRKGCFSGALPLFLPCNVLISPIRLQSIERYRTCNTHSAEVEAAAYQAVGACSCAG